ncbi:MAG: HD domain-containing protein [Lachnospiraceae bacterium]|nr:HD domain-containing protein [Lachnospiraceae bacterium]
MLFDSEKEIRNILYTLDLKGVVNEDLEDSIDHGRLVAEIVKMLADRIGLDEKTTETIYNAACVHDVGKLKLSQSIYGRDKKSLHVEEVRHMRMHARLGAEMLGKCNYPSEIVDAVYHHHECYDGSGYPDNLREDDIPYSSRFIKICDAFAALISDRPYRKGFDKETALGMMIEDNKEYDIKLFLDFMNLVNSPEFDRIIKMAEEMNKKHSYK